MAVNEIIKARAMSPEYERGFRASMEYMKAHTFGTHWVFTSDRMPDIEWEAVRNDIFDPEFLVLIKDATLTTTLRYNGESFIDYDDTECEVECWACLPEPPDLSWRLLEQEEVDVSAEILDLI